MTREEQIREAEKIICTHVRQTDEQDYHGHFNTECSYNPIEGMGFRSGANWADHHPINVWHKSTEQPKDRALMLCLDKHNRWHIGILDIDENLSAIWYLGLLQCYWEDVKIWAYISDLLPKAEEI